MGRTIPPWRIVVEQKISDLCRFKQSLRPEDRVIDDLLIQCKLYAAEAGTLASPIKEVPLLLSMIFAQHKKLIELEEAYLSGYATSGPRSVLWRSAQSRTP